MRLEYLRDANGRLYRTAGVGQPPKLNGYLEDDAFLADWLVTLYESTFDPKYLLAASDWRDRRAIAALAGWRGMLMFCAVAAVIGLITLMVASRGAAKEPVTRYDPVVAAQRYRTILSNPQRHSALCDRGGGGRAGLRLLSLHRDADDQPRHRRHDGGGADDRRLRAGRAGLCRTARWLLTRFGQAGVVRLGGGIGFLALSGLAVAPALWIAVLSGFLLGMAFYMIHNAIQTRATELSQQFRGSAVSLTVSPSSRGSRSGRSPSGSGR